MSVAVAEDPELIAVGVACLVRRVGGDQGAELGTHQLSHESSKLVDESPMGCLVARGAGEQTREPRARWSSTRPRVRQTAATTSGVFGEYFCTAPASAIDGMADQYRSTSAG